MQIFHTFALCQLGYWHALNADKSSTCSADEKFWCCDALERLETSHFMTSDGLYYIVMADLVGSTSAMKNMGNDAGIARSEEFKRAVKRALEHAKFASRKNSGVVVKTAGDAVFLVFKHFPDIVQWHLEFDGVLVSTPTKTERMKARIWVHVGELRFEEDDFNGLSLSELCKIEKKAKEKAEVGCLILTSLAREIAGPTLFPGHCVLEPCGTVKLEGHSSVKLYQAKADLPFLVSKQVREKSRD